MEINFKNAVEHKFSQKSFAKNADVKGNGETPREKPKFHKGFMWGYSLWGSERDKVSKNRHEIR